MPANFMDELFYPGNTVQLEYRPDFISKTTLLTSVISLTDEFIQLALPLMEGEKFIPIKAGTFLTLSAREKKSTHVYYYTVELVEHHEGNPSLIVVKRPSFVQNTTRRNFFRCEVNLLFYYWLEKKCYRGRVINLSASGLYGIIEANNHHLKPGILLPLEIVLPIFEAPLTVEAKIVRINKTDQTSHFGIALTYRNPTEQIQNQITKYLFQRQRELIQEGRIKIGRIQ
jgi:c-di-GMP-binding flagellar brake protein YcgR